MVGCKRRDFGEDLYRLGRKKEPRLIEFHAHIPKFWIMRSLDEVLTTNELDHLLCSHINLIPSFEKVVLKFVIGNIKLRLCDILLSFSSPRLRCRNLRFVSEFPICK